VLVDCVAKASPDYGIVSCSIMVLDDGTKQATTFRSLTASIMAGKHTLASTTCDSSMVNRQTGVILVSLLNPRMLSGLQAHIVAVDENGADVEVTVPVRVAVRTKVAEARVLTTPTPDMIKDDD